MKTGDVVERNGVKYIVTNVYVLGGGVAYDTEPMPFDYPEAEEPVEEPKKKRTRTKK